ncbi:hypothetical protein CHLNCDRAFT_140150 [Chlorella variabilis]|uniref:Transferrin-like domain-containing protein n=1 Tax=Chlorella variabilis TaxID=554065 RepID=E1ZRM5_CHLVA|nr:hypothetical protein CHLNCDRAFT_140150 [Chlorella variabilis]EFN51437.1 hypothetical protein CHLNCDRAFT_140150 [Chlorella variabilis]|eukprot:XP_005843539.1 hypothetical protein CHLNCDRAFT_140150 [Chlorella variabilis]
MPTPLHAVVASEADALQRCNTAVALADTAAIKFSCVAGASMLDAFETYQLEPLISEDYKMEGVEDAAYYSVAVVKKSFCTADTTLRDLKGLRACHSGYDMTGGWTLPVGFLAPGGVIPRVATKADVPADAQSVAAFFSGDVAFTKHSTIMEVAADGTAPQAWSAFDMADMAIVCPSGGCKEVSEFLSCHIARSPAFSVMTTAALRNSAEGQAIQAALMDAGSVPAYLNATIGLVGNFAFSEDTKGIKAVSIPFL